jgi:hypothetical protein
MPELLDEFEHDIKLVSVERICVCLVARLDPRVFRGRMDVDCVAMEI